MIGPGERATPEDLKLADKAGQVIASNNWILLTGGRAAGVMEASMRGAKSRGGLVVGILPGSDEEASGYLDIPIRTNMGQARNVINVLSSDVIVAIGIGPGTASEISLALKHNKPVILIKPSPATTAFFRQFPEALVTTIESADQLEQTIKANL